MRQRCLNPNNPGFHNYGGRGITIDPEWDRFSMFAIWAYYSGYHPSLELDRIDNNGPYSPNNCRWITKAANARNRRTNKPITINGETMIAIEAAERFGIHRTTLLGRLGRGEASEEALRKPNGGRYKYFGERMTLADAARKFGIPWTTINHRIKKGMTPEEAVTKPLRVMRAYKRTDPRTGKMVRIGAAGMGEIAA